MQPPIEVGIPDYYRKDLFFEEIENLMDIILTGSQELGLSPEHYVLEFLI